MSSGVIGNESAIRCLKVNINDICRNIREVLSSTEPIRFASWKFPNQSATEIDIDKLLDRYNYVESNSEESAVAHTCLLELVIDRMIMFMQALTQYMDLNLIKPQMEVLQPSNTPLAGGSGQAVKSQSANLALSTLWQSTLTTKQTVDRMNAQIRKSSNVSRVPETTQATVFHEMPEIKISTATNSTTTTNSLFPPTFPSLKDSVEVYAKQRGKSSRMASDNDGPAESTAAPGSGGVTTSASFLNTDGNVLIELLQEVGHLVMDTAKSSGLSSSMENCSLQNLEDSVVMAPNHINEWCISVSHDLQRIAKHLNDVQLQLISLKENDRHFVSPQHRPEHLAGKLQHENEQLVKKQEALLSHIRSFESVGSSTKHHDMESELRRMQMQQFHNQDKISQYEEDLANLRTELRRSVERENQYKSQVTDLITRLERPSITVSAPACPLRKSVASQVEWRESFDPIRARQEHESQVPQEGVSAESELSCLRAQLEMAYNRIAELQGSQPNKVANYPSKEESTSGTRDSPQSK